MAPALPKTRVIKLHPLAKVSASDRIFNSIGQSLSMFSSMLFLPALLIGGFTGFAAKKTKGNLSAGLTKVSEFSNLPNVTMEEVPEKLKTLAPGMEKHVQSVGQFANKVLGKDLSGRLGKVSGISALQLGISGFSVANTAKTFGDKIRILKHLHRDVTGRDISTMALLMGHNLPPIVKQARGSSLGLRAGIAAVMDAGLTFFNIATMLYPDKQPKFMQQGLLANPIVQTLGYGALMQIPTMLANAGSDPLQVYRDSHLFAAQQDGKLPQDAYFTLIRNLAPRNMSDQEVVARAKQCYTEGWSPKEVAIGMAETYGMKGRPVLGPATARLNAEAAYRQQTQAV